VRVLANANTGLAAADVFFWGSRVADTGTSPGAGTFDTASTDAAQTFAALGSGRPITDPRDFNRDGSIDTTDASLVFANLGSLARINIASTGPFAPEDEFGDAGIASGLAMTANTQPPARLDEASPVVVAIESYSSTKTPRASSRLLEQTTARLFSSLATSAYAAEEIAIDDELLDELAVQLEPDVD
jgi:hypothetical protein